MLILKKVLIVGYSSCRFTYFKIFLHCLFVHFEIYEVGSSSVVTRGTEKKNSMKKIASSKEGLNQEPLVFKLKLNLN